MVFGMNRLLFRDRGDKRPAADGKKFRPSGPALLSREGPKGGHHLVRRTYSTRSRGQAAHYRVSGHWSRRFQAAKRNGASARNDRNGSNTDISKMGEIAGRGHINETGNRRTSDGGNHRSGRRKWFCDAAVTKANRALGDWWG